MCWILVLQFINISIDPGDLKRANYDASTSQEDLSINEVESVYELIAEGVFDKQVPESDEDDIQTISPSIELYCDTPLYSTLQPLTFPTEYFPHYNTSRSLSNKQPNSPPPKRA